MNINTEHNLGIYFKKYLINATILGKWLNRSFRTVLQSSNKFPVILTKKKTHLKGENKRNEPLIMTGFISNMCATSYYFKR
jgi:hypothetical protein